jgi:hypothetical protein
VLIEPGRHALLDVELMWIFLNAVSLARINHHLCFHTNVFQTRIEFISLADRYSTIVDSMQQEGRRSAVSMIYHQEGAFVCVLRHIERGRLRRALPQKFESLTLIHTGLQPGDQSPENPRNRFNVLDAPKAKE